MGEPLSQKAESIKNIGISKFKDAGEDLESNLGSVGNAVKDLASESLDAVKNQVGDLYQKGQKKALEVGEKIEKHVKNHPMRTLLIAGGVVLGIGLLLGMRRRK